MQLYLRKEIINKMLAGGAKGLLSGEQFYDLCYIQDIYAGVSAEELVKKDSETEYANVVGDYRCCLIGEKVENQEMFKGTELQWIKLLIYKKKPGTVSKKSKKKIKYNAQTIQMKAYLQTLDTSQVKIIIKPVKVVIL